MKYKLIVGFLVMAVIIGTILNKMKLKKNPSATQAKSDVEVESNAPAGQSKNTGINDLPREAEIPEPEVRTFQDIPQDDELNLPPEVREELRNQRKAEFDEEEKRRVRVIQKQKAEQKHRDDYHKKSKELIQTQQETLDAIRAYSESTATKDREILKKIDMEYVKESSDLSNSKGVPVSPPPKGHVPDVIDENVEE